MEVLEGQMSAFDFVEDVKKEVAPKENKVIKKKKNTKILEEVENIEGQASIFDLVQEPKEEIKIDFTMEQLETIEKLKKENEWKDLLNKADKEEDEIIEILPGQIGFNI